ncbi:hypothetical protein SANTM175S_04106 [Streptomyces antimycoticus]
MGQAARRRYEQGFSPRAGAPGGGVRTAIAGRSALAHGGDTPGGRGMGTVNDTMPTLRLGRRWDDVVDLGATPPCESSARTPTGSAGAGVPAAPAGLHRLLAGADPPLITPEETFKEYAFFSSSSTSWVEHARRRSSPTPCGSSLGPSARSRSGEQRRVLAEARGGPRQLPRHRAVGERRRRGGTPRSSTRPPDRASAPSHGPADLVVANNVYAHIADVVGFAGVCAPWSADDSWSSVSAAPADPDRGEPVRRSTTSTPVLHGALSAIRGPVASSRSWTSSQLHARLAVRVWARPTVAGEPTHGVSPAPGAPPGRS